MVYNRAHWMVVVFVILLSGLLQWAVRQPHPPGGATAAGLFLRRNGFRLTASNADLVAVTMSIAQLQVNFAELAAWLQDNSQPIE